MGPTSTTRRRHEHGTDSGCGDNNWPKTVGFLAGWGYGRATLNGTPLYQDYEMHFMFTQQIDFYIRSPQPNPRNKPARQAFLHFFGMEITWK